MYPSSYFISLLSDFRVLNKEGVCARVKGVNIVNMYATNCLGSIQITPDTLPASAYFPLFPDM